MADWTATPVSTQVQAVNDEALVADLRRNFPGFAVESWRVLGEGWMSRALLVNETYVFRFAKRDDASQDLATEAALLPAIRERVALAVPHFEYVGTQSSGLGFVGYRLIAGEPLEAELLERATAEVREAVVSQLAAFMDQLHAVPLELAEGAGLAPRDHRAQAERDLRELEPLSGRMPSLAASYVRRRFAEFLSSPGYFERRPRLIHADLSPEHLLFDSALQRLVGIIDFGDLSLGDPDYEYLYLLEDWGPELTAQVMQARGETGVVELLHKVGYYVTFDHVHLILGGQRRGVQAWIDEGVAALVAEAESGR